MRFSHSRVETFNKCPYQFKLRYLDSLATYPNLEADNPLLIGTALHKGLEVDTKTAIEEYYSNFPIINDKHIEEAIKLESVIAKCKEVLPQGGICEQQIEVEDKFIGFIDYLVEVGTDAEGCVLYDLYDFKYSNNIDNYLQSGQLHEYKYFFELTNTGKKIRKLYFLFAPKTAIKMKYKNKTNKRDETLDEFRKRLKAELSYKTATLIEVPYDETRVEEFLYNIKRIKVCKEFEKNQNRLCDWCEFKGLCLENNDLDIDWSNTNYSNLKDYLCKEKN